MKSQLQVISQQTIKPSSPTPNHLHHYDLSFLDQISPPVFMPMILFYPKEASNTCNISTDQYSQMLKQSLSKALTQYYPLAGRVNNNDLYVDCNDEGAYYVEAQTNYPLSQILENPKPNDLNQFLPLELDDVKDLPVIVQVTFFNCGGITVSLGINHKIADALSVFMFLNSWSAISRGDQNDIKYPLFGSAKVFPKKDFSGFNSNMGIIKNNIVTKRFVFDATKIASLRTQYATDNNDATYLINSENHIEFKKRPTRVEALSAFIWSRFMESTQPKPKLEENNSDRIYSILHAVNLRTRMEPPLPESYFGNISRVAITIPSLKNGGYKGIVNEVRESINKINPEFVKNLQKENSHLESMKKRAELIKKGEVVSFSFTSLCRFPIYEADFGWGKPVYAGSASLTFKNLVTFLDTNSGDGIEAWINLKDEDMAKFEADQELLNYATLQPPLYIRY